jgi:hypothetical protein
MKDTSKEKINFDWHKPLPSTMKVKSWKDNLVETSLSEEEDSTGQTTNNINNTNSTQEAHLIQEASIPQWQIEWLEEINQLIKEDQVPSQKAPQQTKLTNGTTVSDSTSRTSSRVTGKELEAMEENGNHQQHATSLAEGGSTNPLSHSSTSNDTQQQTLDTSTTPVCRSGNTQASIKPSNFGSQLVTNSSFSNRSSSKEEQQAQDDCRSQIHQHIHSNSEISL